MSHEWDSYYNNLAPLSCDPSTLKTSEVDDNISQLIDNFTGSLEISDSMATLEPPATNKSFDTNFYSNPETGNSNSNCVFEETSWQGNEHLEKDFLRNCGNSDIPAEFPSLSSSGSFATCYSADLPALKDDCGMLNSFLENYSDISSCSEADVNETNPPCKLLAGTSVQKLTADVSVAHSSSKWLFNCTGNLEFPTEVPSPNVAETNLTLQSSSTMNVDKDLMECAQDQTGNQECSSSSFTSNMVTTENQNVEDRNGPGDCKESSQIESVENGLPKSQDSDFIDHKDSMEDGAVKKQGDNKRQIHFLNVKPTCDKTGKHFNETVLENEMKELILQNNESSVDPDPKVGKAENTSKGKGDVPLLERKNESHSSEIPSPPKPKLKQSEMQPKAENDTHELEKSLNPNSSNEQDKSITKDNNDILKEESSKVELFKNKNSDNQKSHKLVSNIVLNETMAEKAQEKNETLAEEIDSTKNETFENQQSPKPNSTNNLQDTVRETHGKSENRQEDLKELVSADKEQEREKSEKQGSFDPASVGQAEMMRKEEENKNKVTDFKRNKKTFFLTKKIPKPPHSFNVKKENLLKAQKSDKSYDCRDPAMSINKETQNPMDPCLQSDSFFRDTNPCSEEGTNQVEDTNTHSFRSPREAKTLGASMLFDETNKSTEEPSVVMCCEPLLWEESLPDDGKTNPVLSQHAEVKPLQSCVQVRKHLQPVVVLKSLEPSIETSDSYCCTGCQYTVHNVDHLIEHYHNHHVLYSIKYCDTVYIINHEQGEKHLCAAANKSPQLGSNTPCPLKKRKHHSRVCNKCGVKFALFYQYVSHMRTHTGVTPYRCNGCGSYFSQTGSLARHKSTPGRCKQRIFESGIKHGPLQRERHGPAIKNKSREVKEDVAIVEDESPLQKDLIPAKRQEKLPECYIQLADISKTHCCKFCGKSFLTAEKARKHIRHLHKSDSMPVLHEDLNGSQMVPKGKFKCPICPRHFKYSYNRARHLRICVKQCIDGQKDRVDGKYQCPLCSSLFSFASNRHRHINTVCIKDYIAKASKEGLTRLRTKEKNAKPKEKSQSQDNEQPTQSQEHRHKKRVRTNGPGLFKCQLCPAIFRYYSGMRRHFKKHELFKLTGKLFRYRNSASSVMSEQSTLSSAETDQNEDPVNTAGAQSCLTFSCQFCEKTFNTLPTLKKHEDIHQGDKPCGKGFKNSCSLTGDKVLHQRKIQCTVCKMTLTSVKELVQHRKTHSKKGKLQCPDCNQEFPYPVYLRRHLESHRKKEIKLSQIEGQIKMKPQHLSSKTPPAQEQQTEEQLQCSLCKEVYNDLAEIRKHFLTHVSGLSCPFCQQNFTDRRYLVRHMIRHTGYKPYSCTHCGKHFYREIYRRLHSAHCVAASTITEVKKQKRTSYPCSYCPRVFTKKHHQENHHYGHEANTLLLCTQCGQSFGNNKYNSHKKKCMNIEPNPGLSSSQSDLDKGTPQTSQQPLNKALPSSATKVLFKCDHCDQTFRFKSLLMRHLVSHTGLQPYICVHCGERFKTQTKCAQHESSCHKLSGVEETKVPEPESEKQSVTVPKAEGDKKYNCRFCTRTFMKARNLRRHILTHNEVNPYRCKACDSCFSRYDHLKVHQTHCKGDRARLEVCIPKISLDDIGKGWQTKYSFESSKNQDTFDCQICSKSFSTQSVLARHNSMFHLAGSFKCAGCGSSFMHQSSLRKHMKRKRTCAKILKTRLTLPADSEPTRNATKPLSVVRNRILQRIQPHFGKKSKFFCSFCPRVFTNSYQLSVHTYLHTGERPYSCDFCGEKFIRRDYLQRHFLKCSKKKQQHKVPCDICNEFFPSNKLETHKIGCAPKATSSPRVSPQPSPGSPLKGFPCANCSSRFLLFSQLQEHYLTAHKGETTGPPVVAAPLQHHLSKMMKIKEEPLEDSYNMPPSDTPSVAKLDKIYSSPSVAKLDKRKDLDPLACPECNMTFINKAGLSGHLRVHKEVPFHCRICKKGFWNKSLLYLHQRKCRLEENSEDVTAWQMEGPLKAHIDFALNDPTSHFNEDSESSGSWQNLSCPEEKKPESNTGNEKKTVQYQCSECEKTFTDGLMLISHLEEHGREEQEKKRKTCPKCQRVFASLNNLEKHMKMHGETNVKEISCPKCPSKFSTLSKLEEHKVFHDQKRSFSCKVCHLRFRTKISLCEHFSEDHPEDAFHCLYCEKAYSQKKSLYRHYNQCHQNERMTLKTTVPEKRSTDKPPSSQVSTAGDESDKYESDSTEHSDSDSADYFPCHVCGKTFLTSESLEDHQLCHLGKKPHECEECGKCFYQASQLQQHQRMHKSEFQCRLCGRGFVSLFALRKHKHTHGRKRPYRCSKCHLSFKGSLHLAEHMATHREESFPCDICNCVFPSKSSRVEHRKSHSKSDERRSQVSKEESQKPPSYSAGFQREFKYRCGVCSERFKDPEELSEHGCLESKGRLYSCLKCDKHFLHASHLKKHNNSSHRASQANDDYQCNRCDTSYSSSENFLSHLESHVRVADELQEERKEDNLSGGFKCPVCSQCFSTATELIRHFPAHSKSSLDSSVPNNKPPTVGQRHRDNHLIPAAKYECSECGQSFLGTDAFRQHNCSHQQPATNSSPLAKVSLRTSRGRTLGEEEDVDVTGEDFYRCPICAKQFSSKSSLLDHQNKQHSHRTVFKCKVCGKVFLLRRYLRKHEQRHEKAASKNTNKPADTFRCTQCSAQFSTSNELSLHKRLHAEKEVGRHRCDMCYKSFSQLSLLWQHQESHVGQIVYECNECDKAFAFPHLLEEHQLSHATSEKV